MVCATTSCLPHFLLKAIMLSRSLMVDLTFIFYFSFYFIFSFLFYFQNNSGQGLSVMLSHQSQVDGIVTKLIMGLKRRKLLQQLLVTQGQMISQQAKLSNGLSSKEWGDYKRTRQGALAALLLYLYKYKVVRATTLCLPHVHPPCFYLISYYSSTYVFHKATMLPTCALTSYS